MFNRFAPSAPPFEEIVAPLAPRKEGKDAKKQINPKPKAKVVSHPQIPTRTSARATKGKIPDRFK